MNALEFKVGDVVESVFSGRQFTVLGVDEGRIRIALDAERWDPDRWFLGCYFRLISRADIEFTPGQQVRCIDAGKSPSLQQGMIYTIKFDHGDTVVLEGDWANPYGDPRGLFAKRRFETLGGQRSIHYVPPKLAPEKPKPAAEKPKDDGFIPFDQSRHKIKPGDIARFEFEVTGVDSTGAFVYNGGTIWYANQLSFIKPGPEPLKVGDIVRNPQWPVGLTAEIAAIKDGVAAFWQWREYATTSPNPCPVTELVRA